MTTTTKEEAKWRSVFVFLFKDRARPLSVGLTRAADLGINLFSFGA